MGNRPKALLFDVGGVMINNINRDPYLSEKCGRSQAEIGRFLGRIVPKLERGEMRMSSFYSKITAYTGLSAGEIDWFGFYKRHLHVDPDIMDLIRELHGEYTTGYLTNVNMTEYRYSSRILGSDIFDYRFASCYLGMRKPEPRIYRYVLRKMKLRPEELIFIDNMEENVKAASRLGIRAIHYVNRRKLDVALSGLLE